MACSIGNEHIVKQLFSIVKKDESSPDGTTSFSIALGKEYKNIVGFFLDYNVGQSRYLYAEVKKIEESHLQKHDCHVYNP
jgi:hypothetical protein